MSIYKETIKLTSHGETPTFFDITPQVKQAIELKMTQSSTLLQITHLHS